MDVSTRLTVSILVNAVITVVELIIGLLTASMLLISDSIHNLSDTLSLGISYVARLIARREASTHYTFGYRRAEVIAAFFNSTLLLVVSVLVIAESLSKLFHPSPIDSSLVVVTGCVALVANTISTLLLRRPAGESLNIRSAYLHLFSDALSSVVVVISATLIRYTGLYVIDPLASLAIMAYILSETMDVIRKSARVLMEAAPISLEDIRREIESVPGVINAHHCHAWQLGEKDILVECHVEVDNMPLKEAQKIIDSIENRLKRLGVTHTTIQLETGRCDNKSLIGGCGS